MELSWFIGRYRSREKQIYVEEPVMTVNGKIKKLRTNNTKLVKAQWRYNRRRKAT